MAIPCEMSLWMANIVWMALCSWVSSCLNVAEEIARALRTGDVGPFIVG